MNILGLDSSGKVASAALLTDDVLTGEFTINHKLTHSQTLLPMLDVMLRMAELTVDCIDLIAVAAGPGSFTGLRIGASTAKGLGLALDKPLVAVPSVDALAYNLLGCQTYVCPMMDARRQQVYTGIYLDEGEGQRVIFPQSALPIEDIAARLNGLMEECDHASVILLGDGVPVYREKLKTLLSVPWHEAAAHLSRQRAGAVAVLGQELYRRGKSCTADQFVPEYLRLSQAERERAERCGREAGSL